MRSTIERATALACRSSWPGRRTANSSPPSRNASPPCRSREATWLSTASPIGMAVLVVDRLQVVEVEEAERDRGAVVLRRDELALQPFVEAPMVAESRQRIGEGEAHRLHGLERRALVEPDRQEWPGEGEGEPGSRCQRMTRMSAAEVMSANGGSSATRFSFAI